MEMYLLKSGICLAILYGFYKLFLENESMHVFKRFYLLGVLGISFLIPLITFTTYLELPVNTVVTTPVFVNTGNTSFTEIETTTNYWPFILWGLYGLGVLYFSIKFGLNLKQIYSRIKNNTNLKRGSFTHVLLKPQVIPHTFLSYVFLNKKKYEAQEIPDEVIQHEHIHAKQKHSIDILLVELVQILFWFNPFLYFIKVSIKLNHEFLADRAVLKQGVDTTTYQKLLLAFSSTATTPTLANSINYSFIKKRFTVMKKQTSTKAIWLRSLLILPLVAILIFGFSSKEKIILEQEKMYSTENNLIQEIKVVIDENENIFINGKQIKLDDLAQEVNKLNTHLTTEQKHKYLVADIGFEGEVDKALAERIGQILYSSNIRNWIASHLKNQRKSNLKPVVNYFEGKTVEEAEIHYQEMLKKVMKNTENFENVSNDSNNSWEIEISELFIKSEKINIAIQEKATLAEVEEYNKLAKKYNTISRDNIRIDSTEVDRMKFIYNQMTAQQKESAEPFPRLPAPPPTPPIPDAPKAKENVPSPPPAPEPPTNIEFDNTNFPRPVQAPPPPNNDPVQYIKELSNKGAVFFIGPHPCSFQKAIELAKTIKDLRIDISNYPRVELMGC